MFFVMGFRIGFMGLRVSIRGFGFWVSNREGVSSLGFRV